MDANLINPFLAALFKLLESFQAQGDRGKIEGLKPPLKLNGVTIIVQVKGDLNGKFLISTDRNTALFLTNKFGEQFSMPPSDTFGIMQKSAFQEISNIIGGTAATLFTEGNISIDITPPVIIEGNEVDTFVSSAMVIKIPVFIKSQEDMKMDMYIDLAS